MARVLFRKRRSMLFVPGDDLGKIEKATQSAADSLILELEDGVALTRKAEARANVAQALRTLPFGKRERVVRINPLSTSHFREDIEAILPAKPDAILAPKVETGNDVVSICTSLNVIEREQGLLPIPVMVMIESAAALMNLYEITQADSRVCALVFGAEDFASSVGARRTRAGNEVLFARNAIVVAAAAYGLQAIDMVCNELVDEVALDEECRMGRQLGFVGKTLIHPKQIAVANRAFSPSPEEIANARRIIEAFDANQAEGVGAFVLDGRMIDMPVVRQAQRVLAMA